MLLELSKDRKEYKFLIENSKVSVIKEWLDKNGKQDINSNNNGYTIYSFYIATQKSHNLAFKSKIRIRKYENNLCEPCYFIEEKRKQDYWISKSRVSVTEKEVQEILNINNLNDLNYYLKKIDLHFSENYIEEGKMDLQSLVYNRQAWELSNSNHNINYRVTLDTYLSRFDIDRGEIDVPLLDYDYTILEIKGKFVHKDLIKLLNDMGIYNQKISKYKISRNYSLVKNILFNNTF